MGYRRRPAPKSLDSTFKATFGGDLITPRRSEKRKRTPRLVEVHIVGALPWSIRVVRQALHGLKGRHRPSVAAKASLRRGLEPIWWFGAGGVLLLPSTRRASNPTKPPSEGYLTGGRQKLCIEAGFPKYQKRPSIDWNGLNLQRDLLMLSCRISCSWFLRLAHLRHARPKNREE